MKLRDVGWVWEGQGMYRGVHPSIFGIGEGARFFGLNKCFFMFHDTTPLALGKLRDMGIDEVVCEITKVRQRNVAQGNGNGSECYHDAHFTTVRAEAEKVSRLALEYRNVTGAVHDDLLHCIKQGWFGVEPGRYAEVRQALSQHAPELKLWVVTYYTELDAPEWSHLMPAIDRVNFWLWKQDEQDLVKGVSRCREVFEGKSIYAGIYLRDYEHGIPMPIPVLERHCARILECLEREMIAGYTIIGTVLIDGHLEQAEYLRDFIRKHS